MEMKQKETSNQFNPKQSLSAVINANRAATFSGLKFLSKQKPFEQILKVSREILTSQKKSLSATASEQAWEYMIPTEVGWEILFMASFSQPFFRSCGNWSYCGGPSSIECQSRKFIDPTQWEREKDNEEAESWQSLLELTVVTIVRRRETTLRMTTEWQRWTKCKIYHSGSPIILNCSAINAQ